MKNDDQDWPSRFVEGYLDDLYRAGKAPNLKPPTTHLPSAGDRVMTVETCLASARAPKVERPAE